MASNRSKGPTDAQLRMGRTVPTYLGHTQATSLGGPARVLEMFRVAVALMVLGRALAIAVEPPPSARLPLTLLPGAATRTLEVDTR